MPTELSPAAEAVIVTHLDGALLAYGLPVANETLTPLVGLFALLREARKYPEIDVTFYVDFKNGMAREYGQRRPDGSLIGSVLVKADGLVHDTGEVFRQSPDGWIEFEG